jgi:hypothetical protein
MRKITDKKELVKLVSFMVMGDGGVYKYKKNAKFIMNMIQKNKDYVLLCRDILENITSTKIYSVDKGEGRQPQYRLETKTHPFFTKLRDRIYVGNYKSIDVHALKLLDYEALSFLYMSDGSIYKDFRPNIGMVNPSYKVTLNLKRLSYGDLFILKKALKDKLNLEWNINKNGKYYYLTLRTKDINKFMKGIRPYITDSFKYKLLDERPQ